MSTKKNRNSIKSYLLFTKKKGKEQLLHLEFVRVQRLTNLKASTKLLHTISELQQSGLALDWVRKQ